MIIMNNPTAHCTGGGEPGWESLQLLHSAINTHYNHQILFLERRIIMIKRGQTENAFGMIMLDNPQELLDIPNFESIGQLNSYGRSLDCVALFLIGVPAGVINGC